MGADHPRSELSERSPRVIRTHRYVRPPISLILAIGGALLFLLVASTIDGDSATDLEESVFRALNDLPGFLAYPIWPFMQVGNLLVIPLGALVAAAVREFRLAAALLIAGGAKLQLSKAIKDQVTRHRPAVFLDDVDVRLGSAGAGLGFVSGHAVIAVAVGVLVHPYLRSRAWRIALWTAVFLVLAGRVYVGAHMPLDVIAGGAVGLAIGGLLNVALGTPVTGQR